MAAGELVPLAVTVGIVAVTMAIFWWAHLFPNRSWDYPERSRMPKVFPAMGWLFIAVGLLMGGAAVFTPGAPLDMRIASGAILLGGWAFLAMYHNFYVAALRYGVAFRTILGKEHVFAYSDIAEYRQGRGGSMLEVTFKSGVKLNLNVNSYDVRPLLQAIDYHRATGRWPVPASVPTPPGR